MERIERDPDQPREEFDQDALARLAESLKTRGQLQPIRVCWDEGRGVYVILAGERRWRAAKMAACSSFNASSTMLPCLGRAPGYAAGRERPSR